MGHLGCKYFLTNPQSVAFSRQDTTTRKPDGQPTQKAPILNFVLARLDHRQQRLPSSRGNFALFPISLTLGQVSSTRTK